MEKKSLINCHSIFWSRFTSKAMAPWRHLDLCWHLWSLWPLIQSRFLSLPCWLHSHLPKSVKLMP